MEMAGFRIGSLASLLVFGSVSTAVAQAPSFQKTSEIINDNGNGVLYTMNTSYAKGFGAFGVNYICCPNPAGGLSTGADTCSFSVRPTGSDNAADFRSVGAQGPQPGAAATVPITADTPLPFTGPSQWTVTLLGHCYYQKAGHYYFPQDFTNSYSLDVEKPNQN
jgi:hypothetical protein